MALDGSYRTFFPESSRTTSHHFRRSLRKSQAPQHDAKSLSYVRVPIKR